MKLFDKLTQTKFYKFLLLHKKIVLIVLIVVVIIGGIIKNNLSVNNMRQVKAESTKVSSSIMFRINVSGEVKKVRTLVFTKSVYLFEIIEMCGGFSDYADTEGLDLLKVYNSDCSIVINKKVEKQDNKIYVVDITNSNNTCYLYLGRIEGKLNIYKVDKLLSLYEVLFKIDVDYTKYQDITLDKDYSCIKANTSGLININTCSIAELTTLDKIGPSTAEKIIEYRNTNGYFKRIEDIMNVKGIGEAIFLSIKDKICVG